MVKYNAIKLSVSFDIEDSNLLDTRSINVDTEYIYGDIGSVDRSIQLNYLSLTSDSNKDTSNKLEVTVGCFDENDRDEIEECIDIAKEKLVCLLKALYTGSVYSQLIECLRGDLEK